MEAGKKAAPAAAGPSPGGRGRRAVPQPLGEDFILVLQGGGALGAYQAGVFEVLSQSACQPHWVAGISIGAINAALIAGNPPERRLERLHAFWDLVSSAVPAPQAGPLAPWLSALLQPMQQPPATGMAAMARPWATPSARELLNEASASQVMMFGVPGFFAPRFPPAAWQPPGTAAATSYYDTSALKQTLERLIDFDRINAGGVRLSVGAVNVRSGNFAYFDSAHQAIDVRHIMASGALPPGFAAVEIDGEHYWDGGLVSNTPLQYVLDQPTLPTAHVRRARVVFQVDLFAARGALPNSLAEVAEREKDIRFSSRTRLSTTHGLDMQVIAQAADRLLAKLPPALRDDPDALALARVRGQGAVDVVHLIYRSKHYETQAKDYEFSRLSMQEHWASGHSDMARTLADSRWLDRVHQDTGVRVFDLVSAKPPLAG